MKVEIEIKLRLPGKLGKIRRRLRELGFHIAGHRALESNTLFDNSKRTLRKHGKLIRVRVTNRGRLLTYKGPSQASKYKKRPELEIDLPETARVETMFEHMGYHPVFRYEKFRTEYSKGAGNGGKVLLDETPIGNFVEIEGSPRWIDRTARQLGFSSDDYITRSYGYLYLAYCREKRMPPKDMLFKNRSLKK
ncbi:MAG TPA: class IV adenylate cyclase [Terriglobia bacterium]|nr:class IV adenylate cyclase [Terriglobia bacterium]